jgi:hypothetical protein
MLMMPACFIIFAAAVLRELDHYFKMKPGLIRDPNFYLGAKLKRMMLGNVIVA